jgi:tetratricopeptide (TPR) repeat protein
MRQPAFQSRHRGRQKAVLFGREREQAILRECLRDALDGRANLALIGGEAGIGKTSLIHALAREAAEQGALVLTGACYDFMATPPYGPWLDLFAQYRPEDGLPPLPSVVTDERAVKRVATQDALFGEASDFLVRVATQRPLVLVLEDLHWADAGSLEFLRYLSRQVADVPLLILVTYRDTELDRRHALFQLLPALVRETQATRIYLRPLDASALGSLVRARYALSTADESRLVLYLRQRAEGNPLFVDELLRALEDEAVITATADGHVVADLAKIPVPALVRQVIEGRLARLDERSRSLLAIASVIGQDVSIDVWRAACSASDEDLSAVIQAATDLHLLEESTGLAQLRFTHALIREALYHDVDLAQRRIWHQIVGELLASQPSPEPDAVAYHLREAGHERAADWLAVAGERAQQLYAWRTAAERFEDALPLLGSDASDARARGWLLYRIGLLLIYADPEHGITRLSEAERVARAIDDQHLAAYARADRGLLRCLIGDVRRGLADMREGVAALDELPRIDPADPEHVLDAGAVGAYNPLSVESIQRGALALIGGSPEINIRQGVLIFWLAWAGRYAEALALGEPFVRQTATAAGAIQDALGDALAGLGHAYAALARPDEALDAFARAREAYGSIDHHFKVGNTAIYELSEALLPYRADHVMEREWLAEQAEAG